MNFNYEFTWLDQQNSQIQIDFTHPELVSAEIGSSDLMNVTFNPNATIQSEQGFYMPTDTWIEFKVPRQLGTDSIAIDQALVESSSRTLAAFTLVINTVFKFAANQLLSLISS